MKKNIRLFQYLLIPSTLILIALTRLPFLANGYGFDADAWRVAMAARRISETGMYEASRLPGYPFQEIVCSYFWKGGPPALNGLTALMSVLTVLFLILILRHYQRPYSMLAGMALAAVPLFFINSVCSMDYMWALAFILASWYAAVKRWPLTAGLLLGIAGGCRITSLAMMLPLLVLLADLRQLKTTALRYGLLILGTCGSALFCYWPVLIRYGLGFWHYVGPSSYPSWRQIAAHFTIRSWGILWWIIPCALAISLIAYLIWRRDVLRQYAQPVAAILCGIAIVALLFFRLPVETGYLLPLTGFVVLLIGFCPRPVALVVFLLLIFSPVEQSLAERFRIPSTAQASSMWREETEKRKTFTEVKRLLSYRERTDGDYVVVSAWYLPQIEVMTGGNPSTAHTEYVYLLSKADVERCNSRGAHIIAGPGISDYNAMVHGIRLDPQ